MTEGLLYEPRSLWSIANVVAGAGLQTVRFDKRHFYNGERWPIEIRRMVLSGINYTLADTVDTGGAWAADVGANESAAVINRMRIELSVPQRYHLNSKRRPLVASLAPRPRFGPEPGSTYATPPSSLWGQCYLNFDKPLILPRTATIEWNLSAYTPFASDDGDSDQGVPVQATMLWQEEGGLNPGSARSRRVQLQPYTGDLSQPDPLDKWPYPADGYGSGIPGAGAGVASTDWWGGLSRFPAAGGENTPAPVQPATNQGSFASQESTRAGSTRLLGMRTHIDQIAYDDAYIVQNSGNQPSPLSTRIGTQVHTVNGGSNTEWWRPGAPLCLVLDTHTPASVFELAVPITLGPGEQLEVQIEVPANHPTFQTTYHLGVAFNGFAAIEG